MFAGQSDPDQASRPIAIARVAIGFAQGLALYGLNEWEKHGLTGGVASPLFCACAMLILFLPVVLLGGLRTLRTRTLVESDVKAGLVSPEAAKKDYFLGK